MAMKRIEKQDVEVKEETVNVEREILQAVDKVAENDTPFLKQEVDGKLTILGDPTKIIPDELETEYEVEFVLPHDTFAESEFEAVTDSNAYTFTIKTSATQEKITPHNRTIFAMYAVSFISSFFEEDGEGVIKLKEGDEAKRSTILYYRNEELVESTKWFVGKMLGIDDDLIPYQQDTLVVANAVQLIIENPALINTAYFDVK